MKQKEDHKSLSSISLPATILIGCIILGGFYYFSQTNKQSSIERQQQIDIQAKKDVEQAKADKEADEASVRSDCAISAENQASEQYKLTCTYGCHPNYHYIKDYDNYYSACLQENGLK
jgi:uncharacterized protein YpmB